MDIIFNENIGEIYGVFDSLYYSWNIDRLKKGFGEVDYKIDEQLLQDLLTIKELQRGNKGEMEFFFGYESMLYKAFISFELLTQVNSVEEYLTRIKDMTPHEIRQRLLDYYSSLLGDPNEQRSTVIAEDNEIFLQHIKGIPISDDSKWKVFCLIDDVKGKLEQFISLIRRYLKTYYEFYELNKRLIVERNEYIKSNVDSKGIEFFREKYENANDLKKLNKIYISASYFNTYKFHEVASKKDDSYYIIIGRRNPLITQLLDPEVECRENISVLKNLSDETRFKIARFILTGEKFAQEIADNKNISNSTVNYHMNHLAFSGLVIAEKRENKVYYSINKDRIRECIEYLERVFQL